MDELLSQIEKRAKEELEQANTKHPPYFSSAYEAYAVLLQVVEETQERMEQINWHLKFV